MSPWKPLDGDPGPRPVSDSLDAVARRFGAPKASALEALFDRWAEVVGDAIAAHARPSSLRKGTLVVAVDDSAWATELRSLVPQIIERCALFAEAGTVERVDVKVRR
jgi:predicted nucleic acid-binding Zn ribbon protein